MAAAMKILWVFSSFETDRPAQRFAALAGGLEGAYEHVLLSLDGTREGERLIPEGVQWRRLDQINRKRGLVSISSLWAVRRMLVSERPDLVISSNGETLEWLMVNRGPGSAPHLHMEDPIGADEALDIADRNRNWARRRAFPGRNRAFLAPNGAIESAFVDHWGVPQSLVKRIGHGAADALFELPPAITRPGAPVTFGAIAPLSEARRLDRLLRLVATLRQRGREARAVIHGAGPAADALRAEARRLKLGDAFQLKEPLLGAPVKALSEIDVFVETADVDRSGIGLIDAMAAGRPVIAAETETAVETLSDENRLFVKPGADESAMAALGEILAIDPGLRRRVGDANRARATALYPARRMILAFEEAIRDLAGGPSPLMLPAPSAENETAKGAVAVAADPAPAPAPAPVAAERLSAEEPESEALRELATWAADAAADVDDVVAAPPEETPEPRRGVYQRRSAASLTQEVLTRTRGDMLGLSAQQQLQKRLQAG